MKIFPQKSNRLFKTDSSMCTVSMLDLQQKSLSEFFLSKIIDSIVFSSSINKNLGYHLEISCSCCILIFLLNIYYALFPPSNFQNLLCRNMLNIFFSLKDVSDIKWSPFFAEICNLYNISFLQELDLTLLPFWIRHIRLGPILITCWEIFIFIHQKISGKMISYSFH